ncbi:MULTISPECIES: Coenzyme F420 hydrogenase/dehydrogenase, beta subunit C-terminal domain [unclassified Campylobacter]|uniref:Coenzyme F420 hydrogenase/dehydrogenase, beta subunit C-terminal domain n=1 Tax=unclassified Campylobacter TaxID=2593542 RepID=UPI0022E9B68E|nr:MULTISPECIES: Coenzyme F420 hydrogenase/dehydrogenase, beta subunit C-terminal domain [unclassified Campylobacter]MDA3042875.1 Coenzyme F420 hydrogenase/dehydrogenase, beta subunit C-terminal domain [Campylobacter sp. JMF_09 ED2]MDA3044290.1 Coenzyme F420 hydrogenase/dehydrogenase, beta subunit C-terminal domain [Campylobacter sp. JMF_07 ED4]MDA3063639.1 Coenzyme F420 hydrogenase/dehydrogenase, beta subunit C-terminal domain [Campylobacter sp. JMF_11 EL3]MDA3071265.1 Coenzyme F420 hydrogenas
MNIISGVVAKDRCIGCGVCAGLCPSNVLYMDFGTNAHYQAFEKDGCNPKCDICMKVCPFYEKDLGENELNSQIFANLPSVKQDFGRFLNSYEFYKLDEKERISSASGGAGHFIFKNLFEKDLIDYAICAVSVDYELFKFEVIKNADELEKTKSSAYYPLNLESMIKFILQNDARFAISALPCFAKALRLAMAKNPKLRKRVKFIIGLVCGQGKSANFAKKLADLSFERKNVKLKRVNFREKIEGKNAIQFSFKFTDENGAVAYDDRSTSPFYYWGSRAFTPFACNACTDVFAKCADAVLMDAWLGDKMKDFRGTSLVITRNEELDEIFKSSSEFCKFIEPNLVHKSQISQVNSKNEVYFGAQNPIKKTILNTKLEIQRYSNENYDCEEFIVAKMKKISKLIKIFSLPGRIKGKILRILGVIK